MTKLTNKKAIPFTKMEGIGNDYVYINDLKEERRILGGFVQYSQLAWPQGGLRPT